MSRALIVLLSLLCFYSCGEAPKVKTNLEVNLGFVGSTTPNFGGGLMVMAENPALGKKHYFFFRDSRSKLLELETGTWNFTAIGWDGDTGLKNFEGIMYCGESTYQVGGDMPAGITVSAAKCVDPSFNEFSSRKVKVLGCGGFYKFDNVANSFSPLLDSDPDNFCEFAGNMPEDYRNTQPFYKLIAKNSDNSLGLSSDCYQSGSALPLRFTLPTKKVPFTVKTFRSQWDCQNNPNRSQAFNFNSLFDGNPISFSHSLQDTTIQTAPNFTESRLVLPSGITRRGTSPFMSMIPRVLCNDGGNDIDCIKAAAVNSHIKVDWNSTSSWGDQIIFKGTAATTCGGLTSNGEKFSFSNCAVERGNFTADVHRNEFLCQDNLGIGSVLDIYERNGKIYLLFGGTAEVKVYDLKGALQHTVMLDTFYNSVAADNAGNIYVGNAGSLKIWSKSPGGYPTSPTITTTITHVQHLEVNPTGSLIYVAKDDGPNIYVYDTSSNNVDTESFAQSIAQMQYKDGKLYVLEASGSPRNLIQYTLDASGLFTATSQSLVYPGINFSSAYVANSKIYTLDSGSPPAFKTWSLSTANTNLTTMTTTPTGTPGQMIVVADKIYYVLSNSLKVVHENGSSPAPSLVDASGHCTESVTLNDGTGAPNKIINLESKSYNHVAYADLNHLFEDGYELFGIKLISATPDEELHHFHAFDNEEPRTGGKLGQAQEMLSPMGIASFFHDKSCTALKNEIGPGNQSVKNITFTDPFSSPAETRTMNVTIAVPISDEIPDFIDDPSDRIGDGFETENFDLIITSASLVPGDSERMILKVECGRQLGFLESLEWDGLGEVYKEVTLWNTEYIAFARYEAFELKKEITDYWAKITKFQKESPNTAWARMVQIDKFGSDTHGSYEEYVRTSSHLISDQQYLSETTANFWGYSSQTALPGVTFTTMRSSTDIGALNGGTFLHSMAISENNIYGTDTGSQTPGSIPFGASIYGDLDLNFDQFTPGSDFSTFEGIFNLAP